MYPPGFAVYITLGAMRIRPGVSVDAKAVASLIASFQPILTLEPSGAGAEQYLASVSEEAERQYLESPRYAYLVAELEGQVAGVVAMRDNKHLFHLFVAAAHQRAGIARALWEQARQLSQRGGPVAEFTVNASFNSVPVYRSFGFVPAGAVTQVHGIAFLPMRLTLQNGA
jgi:GNAT superfamily N-acetyltransferase